MFKRKFFPLFVLLTAMLLLSSACTTTEDASPEPTGAAVEQPEPTEETEAEPSDEQAAEPTDAQAPEPTKEPAAEPSEAPAADEGVPVAMEMARTASCYLSTGASADELGTVLEGTTVNVLGRGVGAGWLAIEFPNDTTRVCWIHEADVEYDGEFSELPIYGRTAGGSGDEEEPIVLPEGDEYPVLNDVLCLRGPGGGYSTVRALLEGEVVIVHGRGVGMGWYVVALPETGENCWLPDTAIDFTGVYEDLTIFSTPPKS